MNQHSFNELQGQKQSSSLDSFNKLIKTTTNKTVRDDKGKKEKKRKGTTSQFRE